MTHFAVTIISMYVLIQSTVNALSVALCCAPIAPSIPRYTCLKPFIQGTINGKLATRPKISCCMSMNGYCYTYGTLCTPQCKYSGFTMLWACFNSEVHSFASQKKSLNYSSETVDYRMAVHMAIYYTTAIKTVIKTAACLYSGRPLAHNSGHQGTRVYGLSFGGFFVETAQNEETSSSISNNVRLASKVPACCASLCSVVLYNDIVAFTIHHL